MKTELDEKLCKAFPKIFAQRNLPTNQTAMCWGFECGDGWYNLVYDLCSNIQKYCDENDIQVEAVQVKQKFGTLRFYTCGADDVIFNMIREAEDMSHKICEDCGTTEFVKIRDGRWIQTLCDGCYQKSSSPQECFIRGYN